MAGHARDIIRHLTADRAGEADPAVDWKLHPRPSPFTLEGLSAARLHTPSRAAADSRNFREHLGMGPMTYCGFIACTRTLRQETTRRARSKP